MKTTSKTICVIGSAATIVAGLGLFVLWRVMFGVVHETSDTPFETVSFGETENLRIAIRDHREIVVETDQNGLTLLHSAAEKKQLEAVNLLIAAGATVDARDNLARTPLYLAASAGAEDIVKVLLERGADCNARFRLPIPAETPPEIDPGLFEGDSVLEAAASGGHHRVVKLLLDHEAVPHALDRPHRRSALHAACDWRIAPDDHSDPPNAGNRLVIDILARYVDWKSENAAGETPLHLAVSRGNVVMVRHILETYDTINLDSQDFNGDTPLHRVLQKEGEPSDGLVEIVELLLRHGARRDVANNQGVTPLERTRRLNNPRLAQLLLESQ